MLLRVYLPLWLAVSAFAPSTSVADDLLRLEGNVMQGGMMRGMTEGGAQVTIDGKPIRVSDDGWFVLGFGRDAEGEVTLGVRAPNGNAETRVLTIAPREYRVERVDGLPPKMVTPPEEVLARIRRENKEISRVRSLDTPGTWFAAPFQWPASGRISGVYGSQRVLNGEPRRPHYGLDVAAPVGTPVYAPAAGLVELAEVDLYYTGGTVMIDHGHGVTSVFSHLSSVDAKVGTKIAIGDLIGRIGATGRASGAHLDWRVNWFGERLDPELLVGPMPKVP